MKRSKILLFATLFITSLCFSETQFSYSQNDATEVVEKPTAETTPIQCINDEVVSDYSDYQNCINHNIDSERATELINPGLDLSNDVISDYSFTRSDVTHYNISKDIEKPILVTTPIYNLNNKVATALNYYQSCSILYNKTEVVNKQNSLAHYKGYLNKELKYPIKTL